MITQDAHLGQETWELSESALQKTAIETACTKADRQVSNMNLIIAGDLPNQCIGSALSSVDSGVPYIGLYGACSTMAEGLALGAALIDGGSAHQLLAAAASHFCSAERQYCFLLSYSGQRPPTAQWTATAAGAVILSDISPGIRITHAVFGQMVDMGMKDANNIGAAMAPKEVNLDPCIFGKPKAAFCIKSDLLKFTSESLFTYTY